MPSSPAENLARNVAALRRRRNLTQRRLAELAGIPRSTLTHIESGAGNPSLANLGKLCAALEVGIEELLAPPWAPIRHVPAAELPTQTRADGRVRLRDLLPEPLHGFEITRMELAPHAQVRGTPHVRGTREYHYVLSGRISVFVAGRSHQLETGDVLSFPGYQPHSYRNLDAAPAVGLSVVVPLPR